MEMKMIYDSCPMFSNCLRIDKALWIDTTIIKSIFKIKITKNKTWCLYANKICETCQYKKYIKEM